MFSTDSLFFLVIFIVPGAIFLLFNRYLRPVPRMEKDETIRLSGALLFSFLTSGASFLFLKKDFGIFVANVSIFTDIDLLIKIMLVNFFVSVSLSIIWTVFRIYVFTRLVNIINILIKRPPESENEMVWNDIFETTKYVDINNNCIVAIEKEGMRTVGIISGYTAEITGRIEFILRYTTEIEDYFTRDEETKNEEDKIFSKVKCVYIDISNGLKITFYDTTKYEAWVCRHRYETEDFFTS